MMYVREHGVKAWIVKWFNIFGPGQHYGLPQKLVPTTIVRALRNEAIPVFGNGKQTADHIYVKDAVKAAIEIYGCNRVMGRVVEVGHHHMPVIKFIQKITCRINTESRVQFKPMRKGEVENSIVQADTKLLHEVVKFRPEWRIERALDETIGYYKDSFG